MGLVRATTSVVPPCNTDTQKPFGASFDAAAVRISRYYVREIRFPDGLPSSRRPDHGFIKSAARFNKWDLDSASRAFRCPFREGNSLESNDFDEEEEERENGTKLVFCRLARGCRHPQHSQTVRSFSIAISALRTPIIQVARLTF